MAFQVKDDLLDFLPTGLTGKPSGNDIKEKKLTLPLIYALDNSTPAEKKAIVSRIIKTKRKRLDVDKIVSFVEEKGGVVYAQNKMEEFKKEALGLLQELPESESRKSLEDLANYIVSRKS